MDSEPESNETPPVEDMHQEDEDAGEAATTGEGTTQAARVDDDDSNNNNSDGEQQANEEAEQEEGEESAQPAKQEKPDDDTGGNQSSDDELSDLDEDDVQPSGEKPIDEEVYKLSSHRKKTDGSSKKASSKEKTREKNKRSRSEDDGPPLNEQDDDDESHLDPETRKKREIERKLDEAMKAGSKKKKKKLDGDDIEQMQDEKVSQLREQMRAAAIQDGESIRNGQPAVAKLQLLPQVKSTLQKHNLADSILDNNLLETIRMWLEPLPDASLPAFEIQKELFAAIDTLPIKTIHLRESGLGKVVLFYQRSKRPQLSIKRIADRLIGNWTRPIMGRSDNYRDKFVISRTYNPEDTPVSVSSAAVRGSSEKSDINSMSAAEAAAVRRNRAHIPSSQAVSFQVAPKSTVSSSGGNQRGAQDEQYKRLKQKMQNAKSVKNKKSGVSIEGRGLN